MANDSYTVTSGSRLRAGGLPRYPTWRPAPGNLSTLTVANGGLANQYRDVIADYYEPFYGVKSVVDYSGAFKNPHWVGDSNAFGACVFWGGGHAGTNHNAVIAAEYLVDQIRYVRLSDPTPWFGTATDLTTRQNNGGSTATNSVTDLDYMDSTIDGKPGAPHSYASGDWIGPANGGAQYGTFVQVLSAGVNRANDSGAQACHQLACNTTEATTSPSERLARTWARRTNNRGPWSAPSCAAPMLTIHAQHQGRIYLQCNAPYGFVRWFDLETNEYVTGTGTPFDYDEADGFDSGASFYVPSRRLWVCCYPFGSTLKIQWMSLDVSQPTLGGTATLSSPVSIPAPWSAATWVPNAFGDGRIVVGKAGEAGVYEIQIPASLGSPWPVTYAAFGGGGTFDLESSGGGNTYKKFAFDIRAGCIVFQRMASVSGADEVQVYTPRGL